MRVDRQSRFLATRAPLPARALAAHAMAMPAGQCRAALAAPGASGR